MPVFKECCDYWMGRTLEILNQTDWSSGYRKYILTNNSHEPANALLEGSAGIGLVLLSYITGNLDWDQCLMIA